MQGNQQSISNLNTSGLFRGTAEIRVRIDRILSFISILDLLSL